MAASSGYSPTPTQVAPVYKTPCKIGVRWNVDLTSVGLDMQLFNLSLAPLDTVSELSRDGFSKSEPLLDVLCFEG